MRNLVAGIDGAGRSCLLEDAQVRLIDAAGSGKHLSAIVYATDSAPLAPRPPGHASFFDIGVAPGLVRWLLVEYQSNADFPMHHTDTIDLDIVLEGTVELGLDDGVHPLEAGDCVVITGVDHSWKAGPAGCRLSVTSIGTPAPAG